MDSFDCIIVGGGAAAWATAIYARRYNLETLVIEEQFGGETALAGAIENYPGFARIDGFDLMQQMRDQAVGLGAKVVEGKAALLENRYHCFRVGVGSDVFQAKTLVLAMGMEHRTLGLPKEKELKGKGIHYCATCDGPLFKGKRVAVVGGGDSAVKWANQLSDMGVAHVTLIAREKDLSRAEPINRKRLTEKAGVTVLTGNEIAALEGDKTLTAVRLKKKVDGRDTLAVSGVFVAIGAEPRGALATLLRVKRDARGQVDVDPRTMATSVDGVFAAGDVTNASGGFKQIVTAAAQGAIAATSCYRDVHEHPQACSLHAVPVAGLLPARAAAAKKSKKGAASRTRRVRR